MVQTEPDIVGHPLCLKVMPDPVVDESLPQLDHFSVVGVLEKTVLQLNETTTKMNKITDRVNE